MRFRAFFKYFGAKHKSAGRYFAPEHTTIVEPFAGSAAYATRWHDRKVLLTEKDPVVAAVWDYLIHVRSSEVRRLPVFNPEDTHIDDLKGLPEEARALVGFWLYTGSTTPRVNRSSWATTPEFLDRFWGPQIRDRLARQVEGIRHWQIKHGSYERSNDIEATWFIDPPYQKAGVVYEQSADNIDYPRLADWCEKRRGLVMVCENVGADWLPFVPHYEGQACRNKLGKSVSREALWHMRSEDNLDALMDAAAAAFAAKQQWEAAEKRFRFLLDGKAQDAPVLDPPEEKAKTKRTRRTKEQIEAARARGEK